MPMISNSSSVPYASPADFISRVDVAIPGLLTRDDQSVASAEELLTDPVLNDALLDASGVLESVCLMAERYSPDDLKALTGGSLGLLKRIVCGLAIQFLRERRGIMEPVQYPMAQQALKWLDALMEGSAIFSFLETEKAGLPLTVRMQAFDFYQGLPTLITNNPRYWGIRQNRRGFNMPGYGAF